MHPEEFGEHVDLLLKILNSDAEAGEQYWVRDLIAKIDQPSAIYDLLPLLPQIVMERYRSGGVIEGFSKEAKIPSTELGFTDTQADALLREMASILDSDEIRRMQEESPPILLRLFLTDLLAKKEGKRLDLNGQIFSFRIEALDGTGLLLAASDYRLRIGEEQNIVLTSSTGGFPDHQIALKVNFDLDTFMFHFEPLLIHLRPNGAEFSLDVPVEGVNETNLLVSMRGEQVPITWRFIHVK